MNKKRMTIRLTENQMLILEELTSALNTNISLLVRTIVGSWITQNENTLYNIIDKQRQNGNNTTIIGDSDISS